MIKHRDVPDDRRGIYCPLGGDGARCYGAACAWWVDEDEERGHCAALDWGRRDDADRD